MQTGTITSNIWDGETITRAKIIHLDMNNYELFPNNSPALS